MSPRAAGTLRLREKHGGDGKADQGAAPCASGRSPRRLLPPLSEATREKLAKTLVSFASFANPVDATAHGYNDNFASYGEAVRLVLARGRPLQASVDGGELLRGRQLRRALAQLRVGLVEEIDGRDGVVVVGRGDGE